MDAPDEALALLARIVERGRVRIVFQPIVRFDDGATVGVEALVRGPRGSALERPDALLAAARHSGRLGALDWVCRVAAARSALRLGLTAPLTLFVNIEPDALDAPVPEQVDPEALAAAGLRIVVEFTERALLSRPATLVAAAARIRELGWGVALDDVGVDERSLALLPVLSPDVVKLDLGIVQRRADERIAAVANAVNAYAERTGATILAEGIEDDRHLEVALSLGATIGQGWRFGRPTERPAVTQPSSPLPFPRRVARDGSRTPYEIVADAVPARTARRALLATFSRHLELQALRLPERPVLLAAFQSVDRFTPRVAQRYCRLAGALPFVAVLGRGMPAEPAAGVYGSDVVPGRLARQWLVVVLGPHFAGALVAAEREADGRYEFVLTYRRPVVARLARSVMALLAPRPPAPVPPAGTLRDR